jgi:hypothetical protein
MKLIDKDAVLAEIESLLDKGKYHEEYDCAYRDGNNGALYALKGKVNSLEVKEVDLEEELPVSNSLTEEGLFTFKDGSQAIITKID